MIKIRQLLDKKKMTPYALAMKAGVDPAMVYKLIKGKQSDILLSTAFKLADALEVDINELREEKLNKKATDGSQ